MIDYKTGNKKTGKTHDFQKFKTKTIKYFKRKIHNGEPTLKYAFEEETNLKKPRLINSKNLRNCQSKRRKNKHH